MASGDVAQTVILETAFRNFLEDSSSKSQQMFVAVSEDI